MGTICLVSSFIYADTSTDLIWLGLLISCAETNLHSLPSMFIKLFTEAMDANTRHWDNN